MTIPIEIQENLLKACGLASPKYQLLKNGVIKTDGDGTKVVKIVCEPEQAKEFLPWANEQQPDSAARIIVSEQSIDTIDL
jgi:hypothetical protein